MPYNRYERRDAYGAGHDDAEADMSPILRIGSIGTVGSTEVMTFIGNPRNDRN
jgi:hypothetical protein